MLEGKSAIKPTTAIERKPKIGTDCKISISGMMMRAARRLFAAQVAKMKVNNKEKIIAINMRKTVRSA